MTACIEFIGRRDKDGYGRLGFRGRQWLAHRLVWTRTHGDIPDGLHVLHHCDNPPCHNIDHLFLGTHADNMVDKKGKGRVVAPPGELNGQAKLTADQAIQIRRLRGQHTQRTLAKMFNVSQNTIGEIQLRKRWQHLPEDPAEGIDAGFAAAA